MAIFAAWARSFASRPRARAPGLLVDVESETGALAEPEEALVDWPRALDPTSPPVDAPEPFTETPDPLTEAEGVDPAEGVETEGVCTDGAETDGALTEGVETEGVLTEGVETEGMWRAGVEIEGVETEGTDTDGRVTAGIDKPCAAALESEPTASAARNTRVRSTELKRERAMIARIVWRSWCDIGLPFRAISFIPLPSAASGG